MLRNSLVLIPFNAKLEDGCDYALQTIAILSRTNVVVAVLLGDPYSWLSLCRDFFSADGVQLLTQPRDKTWYFRPLMIVPGQRWVPIKKVNVWLSAWLLKLLLQFQFIKYDPKVHKVMWFFEPFLVPAFLHVFSSFESVYDCVDRYAPLGAEAIKSEAIVKRDVDHMTVISEPLLSEHKKDRPDLVKVPLGFDQKTFSTAVKKYRFQPTQIKGKKSLVIGFCGGINYRLDFKLLFTLIHKHPQHLFWFVGPLQLTLIPGDTTTALQVEKLLHLPNVKWTPPVPKVEIPQLISDMDVCLIPYDLKHEFNRYCHPMKGAEYLYLGKPVISTAIVELTQPLYQDLIMLGATAQEFGVHLKQLQRHGWSAALRRRQRQAAISQNWEQKVAAVSQVITNV